MSVFDGDFLTETFLTGKDAVTFTLKVYYTKDGFLIGMGAKVGVYSPDIVYSSFQAVAQKVTYSINNDLTELNLWDSRIKRRAWTGDDFRITLTGLVGVDDDATMRIAEFVKMVQTAKQSSLPSPGTKCDAWKGPWIIVEWNEGVFSTPKIFKVGGKVESANWERGNDTQNQEIVILADGAIAPLPTWPVS